MHALSPVCNGFLLLSATPADLMAVRFYVNPTRVNMLITRHRLLNSSDLTRAAPLVRVLPVLALLVLELPVSEWKRKSRPFNKECTDSDSFDLHYHNMI